LDQLYNDVIGVAGGVVGFQRRLLALFVDVGVHWLLIVAPVEFLLCESVHPPGFVLSLLDSGSRTMSYGHLECFPGLLMPSHEGPLVCRVFATP